jgi:hypothetical protein
MSHNILSPEALATLTPSTSFAQFRHLPASMVSLIDQEVTKPSGDPQSEALVNDFMAAELSRVLVRPAETNLFERFAAHAVSSLDKKLGGGLAAIDTTRANINSQKEIK